MPRDHIPELLATGRHESRAYEVFERIHGGQLAEADFFVKGEPEFLRRMVDELGRALASFTEAGLRHRDLRPSTILLRSREPLDLVITGFGSARLSDFDLESVAPLELTRYSAPEVIAGAVSAASDWWSLGMILLEQVTAGACFANVDVRAFQIHIVTRGVELPEDLSPEQRLLLRGLLTRDPLKRWSWPQLKAWLAGEPAQADPEATGATAEATGPLLSLGKRSFTRPELYALAAAEPQYRDEARALTLRGAVTTWLEEQKFDPRRCAQVRQLVSDETLSEDFRHALVLMTLNPDLPLTSAGDIVTPAWLLAHPEDGYALITGSVSRHLGLMGRELWLVRLGSRAETVRERAESLQIEVDEDRLRVAMLASSRANLEAQRAALRLLYPETDHVGLGSLVERARLTDEELILLIGAATHQFIPLGHLTDRAMELASHQGVSLDRAQAEKNLVRARRELFEELDARTANFARCGIARVDEWVDTFRVERRMPLERAVVVLVVPRDAWKEPPKQQYVANLIELFEKRVAGSVQRGPLVRFVIGKTTPRIDLTELGTAHRPAEALLEHVISRSESPTSLDPAAFTNEGVEGRLRRLVSHALMFRRDTGIDGRFLGFPFLLMRDSRSGPRTVPRIAPVLLWPVMVEFPMGSNVGTLSFDRREEVRLNHALEALLGAAEFARWKAALDDLLSRPTLHVSDVMDILGTLATPRSRKLGRIPGKDLKLNTGTSELACAAGLFNAEFTGQSLSEDLRQMRRMPPTGTGLEAALRVSERQPSPAPLGSVPERERFLTVESDPSQESAVLQARSAPGLLVEGPPGTGKSQTIVNIVSDAIGRGESVLVVCQKQAALRIVQKRLAAEGLQERLFVITDVNRDREAIVRALREQVSTVRRTDALPTLALRKKRLDLASRIEVLEAEVDRYHEALHQPDPSTGQSYRALLGALIDLETSGTPVNVPSLRRHFSTLDPGKISGLEELCAPIAPLWLASRFETSPLAVLRVFQSDKGGTEDFLRDFSAFLKVEAARRDVLAQPSRFDIEDPAPLRTWMEDVGRVFEVMSDETRTRVASWFDLFHPKKDGSVLGKGLVESLGEAAETLSRLDERAHDRALFPVIASLSAGELRELLDAATSATAEVSFLGRLTPGRWQRRRRVRAFLAANGEEQTELRMLALRQALDLEVRLRPIRLVVVEARDALKLAAPAAPPPLRALRSEVDETLALLRPVQVAVAAVQMCPRSAEAETMARSGTSEGYERFKADLKNALARHAARRNSQAALKSLEPWFQEAWLTESEQMVRRGQVELERLQEIDKALGTLEGFQRFRARAQRMDKVALVVLSLLRSQEKALEAIAPDRLEEEVRRIIHREALLAWKAGIEQARPELLLERRELERKVRNLEEADRELRVINKSLLSSDFDRARLGTQAAWDNLTLLRGPRTKRLREILDQGAELGLMHLRPVWLMNPDVASRVLPLKARLFDLVIYDEASQMPVEHAVPTLFRAGRVVISGDEKQMPPTSFFSSRIDGEEEEEFDGDESNDVATEAEKIALEETWNRREVKDCPDLLQLGRGVLPSTTLQIHYRSKYRELINFSNAAFYDNRLNVPVRHPEAKIKEMLPVQVKWVGGPYSDQRNEEEARKVVEQLATLWSQPLDQCPSVGVVTFNLKQADLIEDLLKERADGDAAFRTAYERECARQEDGEDMGFFVKNVENVQGDERDVIIFSTTFGLRKGEKKLRKNFGVLGHAGGERRLNVAVTRARAKVILVTSIPIDDVSDMRKTGRAPNKPRDYLHAYLDYAEKLSSGDLTTAADSTRRFSSRAVALRAGQAPVDGFAAAVAKHIQQLGYTPVAEDDGDAFGVSFAIEDPRNGLFGIAIECDAPQHELLVRARAREIWRPGVIKQKIPKLHRVSSHAWYHHPEQEQLRLQEAIHAALR
nr:AAA domain-containing protein [Corallococcus sp. NCSPR001]